MSVEGRIIVVVPAFNESQTIGSVVSDLIGMADEVVVVDDGSSDDTSAIADSNGATVIEHEVNRGYDRALSTGVDYAARNGAGIIVTFDADGQHDPADVEAVVDPIRRGEAAIVVGRRPGLARPAERLFAQYADWRLGVTDPLSGFKAYDVDIYDEIGYFDRYDSIGTHLMVAAVKRGYTVASVDITIDERVDEPRFGHLRANWVMLKALFRIILFDLKTTISRPS